MNIATKIAHTARLLGPRRLAQFAVARMKGPNPIRPWQSDADFLQRAREIEDHTLVDHRRLYMLMQLARQAARLPGDVAEIGVYRGGTAKFLAKLFSTTGKTVRLFDTFSGMPDTHPTHDFVVRGDFADTSLESVRAFLAECPNVSFHPGLFPESARAVDDQKFSFVHVDVDIYSSVLSCCEFFYPRLTPGGVMVFDDYGLITCRGAKVAVDEFFASKDDLPIYLPSGQCVVWRR